MDKIYNIKTAWSRLSWRMRNGKFEPNNDDKEALKFIGNYVNNEMSQEPQHNYHFAKLYVFVYFNLMIRYDNDNKICEKEIEKILELPLEHHIEKFKMQMNLKEFNDMASFLNLKDNHKSINAVLNSEMTVEETNEKIKDIEKHNKEILSDKQNQDVFVKSINSWSFDDIWKKLIKNINYFSNQYSNVK